MTQPDHDPLSEDEIAMIVSLHNGNEPRSEDPVCKALEARGSWRSAKSVLAGVDYIAQLG